MLTNFLTVGQQVLILFILIGVGFAAGKTSFLGDSAVTGMTDFVLYIVTPCVLIEAFQRKFEADLMAGFVQVFLLFCVVLAVSFLIAYLTLRDSDKKKERVYRFASIFSNCGFMALPLENALFGADGLFYGAAALAAFNIVSWTAGLYLMSNNKSLITGKRLLTNPGILGVVIGLLFFFTSITLPPLIAAPINYLAALNTPIPMVIIGYHLAHAQIRQILKDGRAWLAIAERLIIFPLIALGIGLLFHMGGAVLCTCMVAISTPVAAATTMYAVIYGQDAKLSVGLVSVSTLLSIITLPLMIVLTQALI